MKMLMLIFAVVGLAVTGCNNTEPPVRSQVASTSSTTAQAEAVSDREQVAPESIVKVVKTDEEWRQQLTPEQYRITRKKGTERAGSGALTANKAPGTYQCVACELPLFSSKTKFESGTGWPSFYAPVAQPNVSLHEDRSLFMTRTEVVCTRCDAHLGHVFDDGPPPTSLRYCINSAALKFEKADETEKQK